MKKEYLALFAVLVLGGILFSINLGGYDLWPPDEPRYALVAREMMRSGDYLLPRVNNQPYKEKPPLLFWSIAALSTPVGEVTSWTARAPSVIAALVTLLFTFLLGRQLFSARVALWAVLILLTMQRFWWNARFGQIDMLLTACLTVGWYGYWRYETSRSRAWLVLFYAGVIAGLYAKGPGVLVFPVLFVLAWSWNSPQRREAWLHLLIGGGICVLAYAAWVVPAHIGFARETQAVAAETLSSNMFRQTVGRFLLGVSHANWPWYYLTSLPVDWLPWTLFLPWVAAWTWRNRKAGNSMRFIFSWTLPAFIFFTLAIGKRAVYLLPLFPAMAILFSAGVLAFMEESDRKWHRRLAVGYSCLLLIIALAPLAVLFTEYKSLLHPGFGLFSGVILVYAFYGGVASRKGERFPLHAYVVGSMVILTLLSALFVMPAIDQHKSARDFCAPIRELVEREVDFDLYTVGFVREEYVFYSDHFLKELYTELIPLEHDHGMSAYEMADFQRDLARSIGKAVEKIAIADIAAISQEEFEQLRSAVESVESRKNYDPLLSQDFKNGLEQTSEAFFDVFDDSKPAFLYIQENDWRWIYAIHPDVHGAVVLDEDQVGSRHVLLVANLSGAQLMRDLGIFAAPLKTEG